MPKPLVIDLQAADMGQPHWLDQSAQIELKTERAMKLCPFCAEEIQDAAIKCRYCGSMLATVSDTTASIDDFEEVRELSRKGRTIEALALLRKMKPGVTISEAKEFFKTCQPEGMSSWAIASASVQGAAKAEQAEALAQAGIPGVLPSRSRVGALVLISVVAGVFLLVSFVVITSSRPTPDPSVGDVRSPVTSKSSRGIATALPVSAETPKSEARATNTARAESARAAVAKMVNLGLIKRMDVKTGKFYIDGPLWAGFELNDKESIVKTISGYREAEYKGLPQVTLLESRSGHELADYGAFSGVTIK